MTEQLVIGWRKVPELARDTVYQVYQDGEHTRARSHAQGFGFKLEDWGDALQWPQEGDVVESEHCLGTVAHIEQDELTTQYAVRFGTNLVNLTAAELQPEGWV